jgi:hypothetical protein
VADAAVVPNKEAVAQSYGASQQREALIKVA